MAGNLTGTDRLAQRYAAALFELAEQNKALESTETDLQGLAAAISCSQELRNFLRSPLIVRAKKADVMRALGTELKVSALTQNMLGLMAQKARLAILDAVIHAFQAMLAKHRGEINAIVTSALPLTAAQLKSLEAQLKDAYGAKINLDLKTDSSLLGGLVVQVGSKMVDSSIKTQLAKMQIAMKGAA